MSTDGKQAAAGDAGTGAGAAPKQEQGEQPKGMDAAEAAKVQEALKARNAENKALREANEANAAKLAEYEKAKATAEGNAAKLREIEQAEQKKRSDELEAFKGRAALADRLETEEKARVAKAIEKLSEDDRALVATLPLEKQLTAAFRLAGTAAPAVAGTKPGAPGKTEATVDLASMNEDQAREHFRGNPKALNEFWERQSKRRNTFG